jgi:hypothetical protein
MAPLSSRTSCIVVTAIPSIGGLNRQACIEAEQSSRVHSRAGCTAETADARTRQRDQLGEGAPGGA